jgi:hypothetical protein
LSGRDSLIQLLLAPTRGQQLSLERGIVVKTLSPEVRSAMHNLAVELSAGKKAVKGRESFAKWVSGALERYDSRLLQAGFKPDGITKISGSDQMLYKDFAFPGGEAPDGYDGSDDDDDGGDLPFECPNCGNMCPTCGGTSDVSSDMGKGSHEVQNVLYKAINPQITALTERLEKIEKMAMPGGPALRAMPRPAPEYTAADRYRAQAATTADPELRRGYLDLAAEAERT